MKKCLFCGGDITGKNYNDSGKLICPFCRREYEQDVKFGNYEQTLIDIINSRQCREFIKADSLCDELINSGTEISEVYWQKLLTKFGVVYVTDDKKTDKTSKLKPTFFCYSYTGYSILNDDLYKKAIEYAKSQTTKDVYQQEAKTINALLEELFRLIDHEPAYDIFISFKAHETVKDANGDDRVIDTDDCKKGEEIYNHFTEKGYKVFYSPVSIQKDAEMNGMEYEPRILKALITSKVMILLGSSEDFLKSRWVKNEWERYLYFIKKGYKEKNSLILGYSKVMPHLPVALEDIQWPNFDWFSGTYLDNLGKLISPSYKPLGNTEYKNKSVKKKDRKKTTVNLNKLISKGPSENKKTETITSKTISQYKKDLGSSGVQRSRTIKEIKKSMKNLRNNKDDEPNGHFLLLYLLSVCKLKNISDFEFVRNVRKIYSHSKEIPNGLLIFKEIIENSPPPDTYVKENIAEQVVTTLYRCVSNSYENVSCNEKFNYEILNIISSYDIKSRKEYLEKILEKSIEKVHNDVFFLVLKNLPDSEDDISNIESIAENALKMGKYDIAYKDAKLILDEYEEGNTKAEDILLLSSKKLKGYQEYFSSSGIKNFDNKDFEVLQKILEYLPDTKGNPDAEDKIARLDSWNEIIINSYDSKKIHNFKEFYDNFLQFYPVDKQYGRVLAFATHALQCRDFDIAEHYYKFLIGEIYKKDNEEKSKIFWKLMLCDMHCTNEEELNSINQYIDTSKYYRLAVDSTSNQDKLKEYDEVRIKQINAVSKNRNLEIATYIGVFLTAIVLLTSLSLIVFALGFGFKQFWGDFTYGFWEPTATVLVKGWPYVLAVILIGIVTYLIIMIFKLRNMHNKVKYFFSLALIAIFVFAIYGLAVFQKYHVRYIERNTFSITFVLDNGEEDIKYSQLYGTKIKAPQTPEKLNYTFVGWSPNLPDKMPRRNMIFVAVWRLTSEYEQEYTEIAFKSRDKLVSNDYIALSGNMTVSESLSQLDNGRLYISDNMTVIGDVAYNDCTFLNGIVIPESVESIGNKIFYNCRNLTEIYYSGDMESRRLIDFIS